MYASQQFILECKIYDFKIKMKFTCYGHFVSTCIIVKFRKTPLILQEKLFINGDSEGALFILSSLLFILNLISRPRPTNNSK